MIEFLKKLFSKEWFNKVAVYIDQLMSTNMSNEDKAQQAFIYAMELIEEIQANAVQQLPVAWQWLGSLLAKLDNGVQAQLVKVLIEAIYRGAKIQAERQMARGMLDARAVAQILSDTASSSSAISRADIIQHLNQAGVEVVGFVEGQQTPLRVVEELQKLRADHTALSAKLAEATKEPGPAKDK
jgi:hypothetical protein